MESDHVTLIFLTHVKWFWIEIIYKLRGELYFFKQNELYELSEIVDVKSDTPN